MYIVPEMVLSPSFEPMLILGSSCFSYAVIPYEWILAGIIPEPPTRRMERE